MRIISKNGEFQLPVGFSAEITSYNQVFNDQGEQSIPVDLPATHHNLLLLGFPNRVDSFFKPIDSLQVDVVDGVFMRPARMSVHSANEQDGISCTLYFREAAFYALIDDMTMQDITLDVIQGVGATLEDKVNYLITVLKNEYINQTSNLFSVFPVQTNHQVKRDFIYVDPNNSDQVPYSETFNLVLNGFETARAYPFNNQNDKIVFLNAFMGESVQVITEGSDLIEISKGYGMTAFLDLFYLMQKMFTQLGYSFDDTALRVAICGATGKIAILNNVADAIYDGKLDLNQLIPAISMKDFLKKIAVYMCGFFYVNEFNKKIEFYSYDSIFNLSIKGDLSKYMSSGLMIESLDFKKVDIRSTEDTDTVTRSDVEYIEVFFDAEKEYMMTTHAQDDVMPTRGAEVVLKLPSVGNIIHLNSSVVKNTKVDEENKKDIHKELILVGVKKGDPRLYVRKSQDGYVFDNWLYHGAYSSIYASSDNPVTAMRALCQSYIDWNADSNITISCQMHLPPDVLYSLDLTKHFIIDGQLFFIDRVKYRLPYDGRQSLTLRTYRKYEDRE